MTLQISPLRPNMLFTDSQGNLTKEAYDFLYALFNRVGGSLDSLNAATLETYTWEQPGQLGYTTPNTGHFTALTASGNVNFTGVQNLYFSPTGTGTVTIHPTTTNGFIDNMYIGVTAPQPAKFTTMVSTQGFGCNNKTAQTSYTLGPAAVDLTSVLALANNIRTALLNNGIGM